ncbi:MAG TPA: class A beta-lactamase, partial [Motilibacteraceae bacterium]|nr:class A beta-lactamase [Motilibacteraceae bacterium]
AYRGDERFAFASTIKALAAAVVLDELSTGELSRRLHWTEADLVPYSPVTERHVEDGLTVREVLEAAVTVSDNTAGNLMFDLIGGPPGLDRALEQIGDTTTEVVRREPELNDYSPGDLRDTTTARALATSLAAFVVGGQLAAPDEQLLNSLLRRSTTGEDLIRSAAPKGWAVGDKTGTGGYGTRNDVAVLTPPGRAPVVVAVLTRHRSPGARADDALVAEAASIVLGALCGRP